MAMTRALVLVLLGGLWVFGCSEPAPVEIADPDAHVGKPAPGTAVLVSRTPIGHEDQWDELWAASEDTEYCRLRPVGLTETQKDDTAALFTVQDLDNHLVLAFDATAFKAERYCALRIHLPQSEHAGFWWARESDLESSPYPFDRRRFKPLRKVDEGVFEADLALVSQEPDWDGTIRALRIDPCGVPGGTVALSKVEGRIAQDVPWTTVDAPAPSMAGTRESRSMGLVARASVTGDPGDLMAVARLWTLPPALASEADVADLRQFGTEEAKALLEAGDAAGALAAFSAVGVAIADPGGYLHEIREALSSDDAQKLWPDGVAFLTVEDFDDPGARPLYKWSSTQEFPVNDNRIDVAGGPDGSACALLSLGTPPAQGTAYYVVPTRIALSGAHPFGIRVAVKSAGDAPVSVSSAHKASAPGQAWSVTYADTGALENGWRCFAGEDLVSFATTRNWVLGDDSAAYVVGINVGGAGEFRVDEIQVYIPGES